MLHFRIECDQLSPVCVGELSVSEVTAWRLAASLDPGSR